MTRVRFQVSGDSKEFEYNKGESILECALRNDVDAPYSCLEGVCNSCMAIVKEGRVDFPEDTILSPDEVKQGRVLTCQTRVAEGCTLVVIDYDGL